MQFDNNKILFLLFILVFVANNVLSQEKNTSIIGKVINSENKEIIAYAHILSSRNNIGTISDTSGIFKLQLDTNRFTLKISAIGYFTKNISISSDTISMLFIIKLKPKVYEINQVEIYPLTIKEFKHQFVHNDFPKDSVDLLRDNLKTKFNSPEALKALSPGGMKINYTSNREKQEKKLIIIKEYTALQKENLERISKLTKLEGKELIKFELYCNFSHEFLKYTGKYEIYEEIQKKFEIYRKLK